ncbi:MAG: hypothetical protein LBS45_04430 [Synergistaceae bacterium]|jgi:hypothetical protein|nr:hypothetical protein [Synergistaceae bacterium]
MILATTRALVKVLRELEPNTHLSQGAIVEMAALPALVLIGPMIQEVTKLRRDAERITVKDMENLCAVREVPPRWYNLRFNAAFSAKSSIDLLEVMERCSRLPQQYPLILAAGETRTRKYSWRWNSFPSATSNPNVSGVCEGRGEIVISDVEVYSDIRATVPLILSVEYDAQGEKWSVGEEGEEE